MKTQFTYNFINKTIVATKKALDRASKGLDPEYSELSAMLDAHPNFNVVEKTIEKNESKKTYSKLTIEKMRNYIAVVTNDEDKLAEFDAIVEVAKAKGAKYPLTKKWFLAKYPEFKEADITNDQTAQIIAGAQEEKNTDTQKENIAEAA